MRKYLEYSYITLAHLKCIKTSHLLHDFSTRPLDELPAPHSRTKQAILRSLQSNQMRSLTTLLTFVLAAISVVKAAVRLQPYPPFIAG